MAHVEKSVSIQQHFVETPWRLEGKYLGISEAEPLKFDYVISFHLKNCVGRNAVWNIFSKPYRPSDCLEKPYMKVNGSDVHTSVYDKRDDFGYPIVNFPWLSGDLPWLQ